MANVVGPGRTAYSGLLRDAELTYHQLARLGLVSVGGSPSESARGVANTTGALKSYRTPSGPISKGVQTYLQAGWETFRTRSGDIWRGRDGCVRTGFGSSKTLSGMSLEAAVFVCWWFDQPVLPGQAFRIVEVGGKQVVVSEIGGGVVGFSDEGWGAMARGVVLSPEERYREDPVALPQTQEQLEQFLEPWQFVGQAKLRVADGSIKLSPQGFNGIPWKEGPWNLTGGAPVKKEEINPYPCPEQIREAQGIACLGGIPDGVAADFTPAAMEACLTGGEP